MNISEIKIKIDAIGSLLGLGVKNMAKTNSIKTIRRELEVVNYPNLILVSY